jgi:hypothetical protein
MNRRGSELETFGGGWRAVGEWRVSPAERAGERTP